MTETINGLHKCKAKNTPVEGEVKNMVIEHKPPRNGKKAWIKITNKKPEDGGSPYRILGVEKLDWPPDEHQNIAFNIEVEASSSPPSAFQQTKAAMKQESKEFMEDQKGWQGEPNYVEPWADTPQSPPQRDIKGGAMDSDWPAHAQQGEDGPMSKDDYWRRKEERDEQRQRFIIRQHSQSMALEVLKLKVTLNELTVEDLTPAKLRQLADYFDADVIGAAV